MWGLLTKTMYNEMTFMEQIYLAIWISILIIEQLIFLSQMLYNNSGLESIITEFYSKFTFNLTK